MYVNTSSAKPIILLPCTAVDSRIVLAYVCIYFSQYQPTLQHTVARRGMYSFLVLCYGLVQPLCAASTLSFLIPNLTTQQSAGLN